MIAAIYARKSNEQERAAERMEAVTGGLNGMMPGGLGGLFGG